MKRAALLAFAGLVLAIISQGVAAGGGCHPESRDTSAADGTGHGHVGVSMRGCEFSPTMLYVDPGTDVTWVNKDPVPHTVTGALFTFGSDAYLDHGKTVSYRFDDEGVFPYSCILHPGMAGAIVVGDGVGAAAPLGTSRGGVTQVDPQSPKPEAQPASAASDADTDLSTGAVVAIVAAAAAILSGLVVIRRRRPERGFFSAKAGSRP